MAGGVEVRGRMVQDRDLAGPVEGDPDAGPVLRVAAPATGRRRGRRSPAGRTYGTCWLGHGRAPAADEPAALAVRVGLVRAAPEPAQRPRGPRGSVEDVPTRGRSASASGISAVSSTRTRPAASRAMPGRVRDLDPGGRSSTSNARSRHRRTARSRRGSGAGRPVPTRPSARPCRRSGRCPSGRATGRGPAAPRTRGGGGPPRRRLRRRRSSGVRAVGSVAGRRSADLRPAPSRPRSPAGAQAVASASMKRMVRQRSPSPDAGRNEARDRDVRPLAGRDRRQRQFARQRRRRRRRAISHVARSQPSVPEVAAVLQHDRPRSASSAPDASRTGRRQVPVLPQRRASGVRSGNVTPSSTNVPSLGTSPKSPPYAQRTVPSGSALVQAVVPPLPDEPALEPVASSRSRPSTRPASRCCCPSRACTRT